jgi:hypothetical protein
MFNRTKVIAALTGEVGWSQPLDPTLPVLSSGNLTSRSGYRFDENPYVKIKTIKDTQDYPQITDAQFNTLLQTVQGTAIANVVNSVFNSPDFVDRQMLYVHPNNKVSVELLPIGFVGYKLQLDGKKDLAFELTRVLLEFQGVGNIKLLLFNTAKSDPIQFKEVAITSTLQEVALNWKVDNSDTYYKGDFYLGYLTDGLEVQPFKRGYQSANSRSQLSGLSITPVYVDHLEETLFDLTTIQNTSECYGLNMDITVFEDYTNTVCQNKALFSRAIQLQGQIDVLTSYMASMQVNASERTITVQLDKILIELEGIDSEVKITGLKSLMFGQLAHIRKELRKLKEGQQVTGFTVNSRS